MNYALIGLFLGLFATILLTRFLPYLFSKQLKEAKMVAYVGKQLPAYIMLLLLIYEIEIQTFLTAPYGIMEITALFLLTLVHYWQRNLLLSLLVGAGSYLVMIHCYA